jgi:hypothetical protein
VRVGTRRRGETPAIDPNDQQLALALRLRPLLAAQIPGPRCGWRNDSYGAADAAVCRAMLAHLRPARLMAVGSAYPTALALDEADSNHDLSGLDVTCVEPHPERLLGLLKVTDYERITLLRRPVGEAVVAACGRLGPGDVLCTDSADQVSRAGPGVAWLLRQVLPSLVSGVIVALRDVFWPLACDQRLLELDDGASSYPARALLPGNPDWHILFSSSWLWRCHPELVPHQLAQEEPGSIWIRKVG